ncbi:MFS general substrate transporter [Lentithecium fluviatile CBS 122367]|uniref:MFS general substrate transporter n=1 Tax=Lentithecium fluviatile CBS 122367 TaxID=1168545 RepID=A0A6G1JK21_9PLEO|nr:MFS general substrate transporter [Lentithecium fluviatile CBS 122367]
MSKSDTAEFRPDWRFWIIYVSLFLISFAAAVDNTIVFTALPSITQAIGGGGQYVWIANSYVVASTAIMPLFGQISNIFGRRIPSIMAVAVFALGSGISGGAHDIAMLIAGRTIQGIGCGGIFVFLDIIVCDLVPLRWRGQYLGPIVGAAGLGSTMGPVIGGALVKESWRWVLYITLPFSGLALVVMMFFMKLQYTPELSWRRRLMRIDIPGNALFVASVGAILVGLIMGGTIYPWKSYRVILPIAIGFAGWAAFSLYQLSPRWCPEPTIPPRLFNNRTSAIGFVLSFLSGMLLEWIVYFYPLYFQALQGASALKSGVNTLPFNACLMPAGIAAGTLMTKTGIYKPLHAAAYALTAIGLGLTATLKTSSSIIAWVFFQLILAAGIGCTFVTILPAIQAGLPESDVASSTSLYAFFRGFGFIWGVTIPSLVLNSHVDRGLHTISDPFVRDRMSNGGAYEFAAHGNIQRLPREGRSQVLDLYTGALRLSWLASIAFALLGFILVLGEKHIKLRKELNTEFKMEEVKMADKEHSEANGASTPNAADVDVRDTTLHA